VLANVLEARFESRRLGLNRSSIPATTAERHSQQKNIM